MCMSKDKGGLGFGVLSMFNDALLVAKQVWRLMECPKSLSCRLFAAKYYNGSSIPCASLGL